MTMIGAVKTGRGTTVDNYPLSSPNAEDRKDCNSRIFSFYSVFIFPFLLENIFARQNDLNNSVL